MNKGPYHQAKISNLTNVEREQVGKVYKSSGGNAATDLGFSLVNDETKYERVESWIKFISKILIRIFTVSGGKRSEIAVKWLKEKGVDIPRISGGFKAIRNCVLKFSIKHQLILKIGQ